MIGEIHMERLCEHTHLIRVYEYPNTYANEDDYFFAMNVVQSMKNKKSCVLMGARGEINYTQAEKREAMERINVVVALYGKYDEIHSKRHGKWRTVKIINCLGK